MLFYVASAVMTGHLKEQQRKHGGGQIHWGGAYAKMVQTLWVLIALQPLIHVSIYFRKQEHRARLMCAWFPVWLCCHSKTESVALDEEHPEHAANNGMEKAPIMRVPRWGTNRETAGPVAVPGLLGSDTSAGGNEFGGSVGSTASSQHNLSNSHYNDPDHICSVVCDIRENHNHNHSYKHSFVVNEPVDIENVTVKMLDEAPECGSYESIGDAWDGDVEKVRPETLQPSARPGIVKIQPSHFSPTDDLL
jgi:hypothetical protein